MTVKVVAGQSVPWDGKGKDHRRLTVVLWLGLSRC